MTDQTPSEQQLLVAGFILDNLDTEEARILADSIANGNAANNDIQNDIAQLQHTLEAAYATQTTPPPGLKQKILTAYSATQNVSAQNASAQNTKVQISQTQIPQTQTLQTKTTPLNHNKNRYRPAQWITTGLGAVAAGLILLLGIQNYQLRQTIQTLQADQDQPTTEKLTYSLAPTEDNQLSELEVTIDTDQLNVAINTAQLPPLEEGQVYALWTVVEDSVAITKDSKNAVLTATFTNSNSTDQTNSVQTIAVPQLFRTDGIFPLQSPGTVKAIAVTVEDATAPQQHQSSPKWIYKL